MKKISTLTAFLSLAALMALPVLTPTKASPGKTVMQGTTIQADGSPMPPLPPHGKAVVSTIIADGSPIPPLPPQDQATDAADGSPIPPMPPHLLAGSSAV
jgi:hypothetical protein